MWGQSTVVASVVPEEIQVKLMSSIVSIFKNNNETNTKNDYNNYEI